MGGYRMFGTKSPAPRVRLVDTTEYLTRISVELPDSPLTIEQARRLVDDLTVAIIEAEAP